MATDSSDDEWTEIVIIVNCKNSVPEGPTQGKNITNGQNVVRNGLLHVAVKKTYINHLLWHSKNQNDKNVVRGRKRSQITGIFTNYSQETSRDSVSEKKEHKINTIL